jgi:hypothetical protein
MFLEMLGLFSPTLPKLSDVGEKVAGKTPVCGLPLALSAMLKASTMQAVERITAFPRCRWTTLVSMGDTSCTRLLPIPARLIALDIHLRRLNGFVNLI